MSQEICPRIVRREIPPKMVGDRGYRKATDHLRRDFAFRCGYCMIHEDTSGGREHFEIGHFQPRSRGGEVNNYDNLYWACRGCNNLKGDQWPSVIQFAAGYRYADPCTETDYGHHFVEEPTGELRR
jgi:5-methylcytosine-specific restriction endonuclease McrA